MEFFRRRHDPLSKLAFPDRPLGVVDLVKDGKLAPLEIADPSPPPSILDRGNSSLTKMRANLVGQKMVLADRIARDSEDLRQVNLMLAALDKGLSHIANDQSLATKDASKS